MQRCRQPSMFARLAADQRGGVGLLLAVGAAVLLLVLGTTVAAQTRQELRMAVAETEAAAVEARVQGLFNEAAVLAAESRDWPDTDEVGCVLSGTYPRVCRDVKTRRSVTTTYMGDWEQIPVRVKWQATGTSPVMSTFGWVMIDTVSGDISIWYNHHWCTPSSDYLTYGPCEPGG